MSGPDSVNGAKGDRIRSTCRRARRKKAMRSAIRRALARVMTSFLGLCEIMKGPKKLPGDGGGCRWWAKPGLGKMRHEQTRPLRFSRPKVSTLRTVTFRGSLWDSGGDEKVRIVVASIRQGEESQRRGERQERHLIAMARIGNREGQGERRVQNGSFISACAI